jgi:hypothetical protein
LAIFHRRGSSEGNGESEDLTQYVRDSIADVPTDPTGGRLGEEEQVGAEILAETLEGFEAHLHHPEWHPGARHGKTT